MTVPRGGTEPRRITCVISSLGAGGAERVMSWLTGALASQGSAVTLVTLSDARADFHALPRAVTRVALGVLSDSRTPLQAVRATAGRVRALRRAVVASRPDVVLSFMDRTNVLVLLALRGTSIPVVVAERNNPWLLPVGAAWDRLRRLTYPWARRITVQSAELVPFFAPALHGRVRVIPNGVAPVTAAIDAPRGRTVLAAGRLEPQKGFDLLIDAFAMARPRMPAWSLRIVGEGSERAALEARVRAAGLEADAVALPGRIADMGAEYARCGLFVLSSRFEGFPNVLAEAMAAGCAVIATRCPTGPSELVRDGIDGRLVEIDAAAIAEAMVSLARDDAMRRRLGERAREVTDRFAPDAIATRWRDVLREAMGRD
ncbi:MAG: glycosyltransferase family 4 protein [Gemmatimonadaceae bacterium]|nr:glycosyltransferase family 4 protein [Gemmatimonadaceae bacterium]